jgi:hypothetical protein
VVQQLDDTQTAVQIDGDDGNVEVLIFAESLIQEIRVRLVPKEARKFPLDSRSAIAGVRGEEVEGRKLEEMTDAELEAMLEPEEPDG